MIIWHREEESGCGERDIVAYVRSQLHDGTWSPWYLMDHADSHDGATRYGTEPIYVEPTTRVQVSTGNVDLLEDGRETSDAPTTERVQRWLDMLGLDPDAAREHLVITPTCGLAGAGPDWARRALSLSRTVASNL